MIPPPTTSPLLPYTTLFRSLDAARGGAEDVGLLMLADDDEVTVANPAAQRWLDDLGTSDRAGTRLPLVVPAVARQARALDPDRKSTRLNSSHPSISYAVFCL